MKNFDKIKRRLDEMMSEDEAKAFDKELEQNKLLAKEYHLQKMEENILDFAVEDDLLEEIKAIRKEQKTRDDERGASKVVPLRNWRGILSIAAGLALIAVAYFALLNKSFSSDPFVLAQNSYLDSPPNLSGTKAITEGPKETEENILLLSSNDPEEVASAISFFEEEKANSTQASYYLGHGYWKTQSYSKALLNFEYFIDNTNSDDRLIPQAEFYKSLSLLANNKIEEAMQFIEQKIDGHPFEGKWEPILNKLERIK